MGRLRFCRVGWSWLRFVRVVWGQFYWMRLGRGCIWLKLDFWFVRVYERSFGVSWFWWDGRGLQKWVRTNLKTYCTHVFYCISFPSSKQQSNLFSSYMRVQMHWVKFLKIKMWNVLDCCVRQRQVIYNVNILGGSSVRYQGSKSYRCPWFWSERSACAALRRCSGANCPLFY